jgi:glycosyltransferase involved in cell wall biosynthesis
MKILHLSTSDIDSGGARAAYRLNQGLQLLECSSQMLVRAKFGDDRSVLSEKSILTKLSPPISSWPLQRYPKCDSGMFSSQWFPDTLATRVTQIEPDIINLHWVCNGFLRIETLPKFEKPLVWTLHDMWPFTGGCHYNQGCEKYQESCGSCPQLDSNKAADLSRQVWQRKSKAWKNLNLTIVSPSKWLAECAQASSLFQDLRIELIPYSLDVQKYQPIDRTLARNILGLPQDKQIVLFGAIGATSDPRKGFHLLLPALQKIGQSSAWQDKLELAIFGASQPIYIPDYGFRTHYLGRLGDDISLALVYAAADVFVAPSIQDNLPNTVMEALSCGIPSVTFKIGGMPDMIEHEQTGYLATPFEVEDLAKGITWVLEDRDRYQRLQHNSREKSLKEFAPEVQAGRYLSLYEEILQHKRSDNLDRANTK